MTLFEQNSALLDPELVRQLEAAGEPEAELDIAYADPDTANARYGGRFLHAPRDPVGRPRRIFTADWVAAHPVVVFFGFGFGYEVEAFLERPEAESAIVVEPDAALFRSALEHRDLTGILSSPRITFLIAAEPDALAMVLRHHERRSAERSLLNASVRQHREYFDRLDAVMAAAADRARINANTLRRFGRLWVRNLIRNMHILEMAPGVSALDGRFAGLPAMLCAAGPSLDLVLPRIRELAQRVLVVAVDTAVPQLLDHGIEPDFAIIVDPQYWNTRHLDRRRLKRTVLISEGSAHPRIFRMLHNPSNLSGYLPVYLCSSIFPLGSLLEERIGEKGKLGTGGSVSTTAWDFTRLVGANPIYCTGLDLGFPDSRTHVHGSFFEERMHTLAHRLRPSEQHSFEYLHDADPFVVPANNGGTVLTDQRMMIYTWWFANQARIHADTHTVNLSPGGVAIDGIPLENVETLLSLPIRREEIDARLNHVRATATDVHSNGGIQSPSAGALTEATLELADNLECLAETARRGITVVDELLREPAPDLSPLDAIDTEISRFPYKDIVGFLLQDVADSLQKRSRERGFQSALESSRQLYEGLVESAEYHVSLLREAGSI